MHTGDNGCQWLSCRERDVNGVIYFTLSPLSARGTDLCTSLSSERAVTADPKCTRRGIGQMGLVTVIPEETLLHGRVDLQTVVGARLQTENGTAVDAECLALADKRITSDPIKVKPSLLSLHSVTLTHKLHHVSTVRANPHIGSQVTATSQSRSDPDFITVQNRHRPPDAAMPGPYTVHTYGCHVNHIPVLPKHTIGQTHRSGSRRT
ncbi:hypothetical protein P4O66_008084 [Electrophorus voltai]|uniref:Uncharacterized protein n=1 Tax=Electrophorus voltai TaxID=2609070 RepID=A0AAD9E0A7_9TELE|nr:hypothetical protein P4O66_008084 [Electrophorus voltai]